MTLTQEWTLERFGDVTLVELRLHNDGPVDRRVRVRNRLAGPVLPPRSDGVPDPGWDEEGYAGVVPAGATRALGYATPTDDPVEPPVTVDDEGRAGDGQASSPTDDAVRLLGAPGPPRDAVPAAPAARPASADERCASAGGSGDAPEATDSSTASVDGPSCPGLSPERDSTEAVADSGFADEAAFEAAERRIERAERFAGASVVEAAAALESLGGVAAAERLSDALDDDATALRSLADRAQRAADRAEAVEVPLESLRWLA